MFRRPQTRYELLGQGVPLACMAAFAVSLLTDVGMATQTTAFTVATPTALAAGWIAARRSFGRFEALICAVLLAAGALAQFTHVSGAFAVTLGLLLWMAIDTSRLQRATPAEA
jgi:hypothetical protein